MIIFPQAEHHAKGWGSELWIANNDLYCGKLLRFVAGCRFSMHYHMDKHETWYVLAGELRLHWFDLSTAEPQLRLLAESDVIVIPPGNPHQLVALTNATIIEISTPHREADSYRIAPGDSQR